MQVIDQAAPSQEADADLTEAQKLLRSIMEKAEFQRTPLKLIVPGNNPREYFDPLEQEQLTDSVRQQGVFTPIILRPSTKQPGKLEIVVGERRFRAASTVFDQDYGIPSLIVEMTDEEAAIIAGTENTARANMSPTEEAKACASTLGSTKGDRELAAKMMGMSLSTFNNRLALMNCAPDVKAALNRREINLGHAELLAALNKASQEKFLKVIIVEKRTVAEIKQAIAKAACKLDLAFFDKSDCLACPHNSTIQASMFAESIGDGGCTNPACYNEKTESALQAKVDELKDEYPVIRIVRIGDNNTRTKLVGDGLKGVGLEQAEQCRSCANFGAAISGLPDSIGMVYPEQCFDTICNTKKVAARIEAEKSAAQSPKDPAQAAPAGSKLAKEPDPSKAKKPVTSVVVGDRIKAYREKIWREGMKREIASNPELSLRYLLGLALSGQTRHICDSSLKKAFSKLTDSSESIHGLAEGCKAVEAVDEEIISKMTTLLAASAMAGIDVPNLQKLSAHHNLEMHKHWKLDTEFLQLLTKSEIEVVAKEVGLDKKFGDEFKKLFTEKKEDLIKKLLAVNDFDYSAKIPKVLRP